VDDNPNDRRLIRRLLQSYKRYRVYEARDGIEAVSVIRERKPDLVVTDLTMPEDDGFSLLETLKKDPETANIPVVVVSAKSLSREDRERLAAYSESVWLKGGFDTRALVDHVVTTLGHQPLQVIQPERVKPTETSEIFQADDATQGTPMVVVIDDNPQDLRLARRMLESGGKFHIIEESSGREGLKAIYKYHPDLIILDLMLPDVDGFSILDTLQKDTNLNEIPVIVFSAKELTGAEESSIQKQIRSLMQKSSVDRKQFLDMVKQELK